MRLVETLRDVAGREWSPVGTLPFAAFTLLFAVVAWLANSGERWVHVLDAANLAFHEAGHPLFGLVLGERITVYGGTLMQLLIPLLVTGQFWWRREAVSFAACAAWTFENFWNISRYMADARAQVLPLVGNGEHDWTEIFTRWGVLHRDTGIAGFFWLVACVGVLGIWLWLLRRWMLDRDAS